MFGKGSPRAIEHGLYLEEVAAGLPPTWHGCYMRAKEADEKWKVISLFHLDDHDLVVTKLGRFSTKDRADIEELCEKGFINPEVLKQRIEGAYPFYMPNGKDEDPVAEAAFKNLKTVLELLD